MSPVKKPIEEKSPLVSPRERQLLDELNRLKAAKTKLTVNGFCKHVGYANRSALRHFSVLRRELNLYIAQSAPPGKASTPSTVKYLEVQIERLNRENDRLKRKVRIIPTLNAKIERLATQAKRDSHKKKQLRAMLSTVVALLSGSEFAKARELSAKLEQQARALLDEDPEPA